ncbi:MAG: YggS family pyridoxal phosphate-dependent enzyme [Acidobacteriales bacterium]|nr:YggS family pyridoxal phosphate-dependent enzyme [Terriglobales bacterium]
MSIADNIASVRERIVAACKRSGRSSGDVQLMAVSKTQTAPAIREAYEAGVTLFGENRVQEFAAKYPDIADLRIGWHLIGPLQSNKAARAVQLFEGIDSVDSLKLAERLNRLAQEQQKTLEVLIEINIGEEPQKSGLLPGSSELHDLLSAAERLDALQFRGLMCIPPQGDSPEQSRPYFQRMAQLREELSAIHIPKIELDELSMGMTHDFEIAIEEGSTCVRVGTAIFGARVRP